MSSLESPTKGPCETMWVALRLTSVQDEAHALVARDDAQHADVLTLGPIDPAHLADLQRYRVLTDPSGPVNYEH